MSFKRPLRLLVKKVWGRCTRVSSLPCSDRGAIRRSTLRHTTPSNNASWNGKGRTNWSTGNPLPLVDSVVGWDRVSTILWMYVRYIACAVSPSVINLTAPQRGKNRPLAAPWSDRNEAPYFLAQPAAHLAFSRALAYTLFFFRFRNRS